MTVGLQVDFSAPKFHPLRLQQESLFQAELSGQGNAPTRTQYSLPGQSPNLVQYLGNVPGATWKPRGLSHRAIGTHATARDLANRGRNSARHAGGRVAARDGRRCLHAHDKITPMAQPGRDPKARFSDRVDDYIKYRPRYGPEVVDALAGACGLNPRQLIADVGCGTGFSAEPFLQNGNRVIGVEPNREMREAGKSYLASYKNFEMREGSAERTGLPDSSVDFVLAGQAFHWFPRDQTRAEFARVLTPGGWCVLIWHDRSIDASPFLRAYEEFLRRHAIDYQQVVHRQVANFDVLRAFFVPNDVELITIPAQQRFDFDGLRGRLLSSSYIPREGPKAEVMLAELPDLFSTYQQDGHVIFQYETKIFYGHLSA
jgi:SAM-dependent methyltransferase